MLLNTYDTLWGIARRYSITVDDLCRINNISTTTVIHPGDKLKIYSSTTTAINSVESLIKSYPESGTFIANRNIPIKSSYLNSSQTVDTLMNGESIYYDSVFITSQFVYISYIGFSGIRRYITIRTHTNSIFGTIWGTII